MKLYVAEPYSDLVARLVKGAETSCCSLVGYAEARAALGRRRREGSLNQTAHDRVVEQLDRDWLALRRIVVDEQLARAAGVLANEHGLRGFDAVHLASALRASLDADQIVSMLTFDEALGRASEAVGLEIPERS